MRLRLLLFLCLIVNLKAIAQAPNISSFTPSSGPVGTLVTVTGSNLGSPTAFTIGGTPALVISNTGTQLVGFVMPGATTGVIGETTLNGSATSSNNFTVTATPYPTAQQGSKLVGIGPGTQGMAVAISADGNTAVVGGQGATLVFTRSGNTWAQQGAKLIGTGGTSTGQGLAVAISADGNTLITGDQSDNSHTGAAWVFTRSSGVWTQQGNKLVGTGSVGAASQGVQVALSADGNTAAITGSQDNGNLGAGWVFTRTAGTWTQQGAKLTGTGATGSPYIGGSLALSADGNTLVLGAERDNGFYGSVWVFTQNAGVWAQQGNKITPSVNSQQFGWSVALSADGNTMAVGAVVDVAQGGALWIFTRSGGTWSQQGGKLVGTGSTGMAGQGNAVGLSADGNTAVSAGYEDNSDIGAMWTFTRTGTTWTQKGSKLVGTGYVGSVILQGQSVAISADGSTTLLGGPADNGGVGATWVFSSTTPAVINSTTASGSITACAGTASASPNIQQFTVSGSNLSANITATAPTGFEVSLTQTGGYGNSINLPLTGSVTSNTIVYVRSAATAGAGSISGNVTLASGTTTQNVSVNGTVNPLLTVNSIGNQTVANGSATTAINFTGSATAFTWVNNTPGIGLAASGTGNITAFNAVNTGSAPVTATVTVTPVGPPLAYITNYHNSSVSVINTATNSIITSIPTTNLSDPFYVAISPDGSKLYVADDHQDVSVINTATNTVSASFGSGAQALAISPDGSKLYVAIDLLDQVSIYNTATNLVTATISLPTGWGAKGLALSPDGSRLYVTSEQTGYVSVINTATNTAVTTIKVGIEPWNIAISPDGSRIYVSNINSNSVSVINTATNTVVATVSVGVNPQGVAVTPDGSRVYVANPASNTVSVISTATNTVLATIVAGSNPWGVSVTPDGSHVYVTNQVSSNISVISTASNNVTNTIQGTIGSYPTSLGSFISKGSNFCATPTTFTITVNPTANITASSVSGSITTCAGTASTSMQQFTVAGNNLSADITATAPGGFEVSLSAASGFGSSVTVPQTNGVAGSTTVYVRAAATAAAGSISGNVVLSTVGATSQNIAVNGTVNVTPTVNNVANQTVLNNTAITPVNFTGNATSYTWTNDTPGIGLAASGTGNIVSFNAVNTGSTPVTATITVTPHSIAGFAYINNFGDSTESVVNIATNTVIASFHLPGNPTSTTVSPDGSRAYITTGNPYIVSAVNTQTNSIIASIPVGTVPQNMVMSPDGSTAYVTNAVTSYISVIKTATNTVTGTIATNQYPSGIAISPDGSRLYVTYGGSGSVLSVIDIKTGLTIANISVGQYVFGVAVTPDGSKVYVTKNQSGSNVSVISTATNSIIATLTTSGAPYGVAVSPDGNSVYVASNNTGVISVISTATNMLTATIALSSFNAAYGVSFVPDGSRLYVTNTAAGTLSVIDPVTNTLITTVKVGKLPEAFANFVTQTTVCPSTPVTFTITVNPTPNITAGNAVGNIATCAGTASTDTQQFTVSGNNLSSDITATAPSGFEVSLSATSGFSNSVAVAQTNGTVANTTVYVRSASAAAAGNISGNVVLASGSASQNVAVNGTINSIATMNTIANQTVGNNAPTTAINFTGNANTYTWTNDTPGIGLPASGTGDIASFTAVNPGKTPITATITATPSSPGLAYVANIGTNDVSVVNTASHTVVATIPVGLEPWGTALSPDGSRLYVTNASQNSQGLTVSVGTVSVINTSTNKVTATITVGDTPVAVVVSPDGKHIYVANVNDGTLNIINTTTNLVESTLYINTVKAIAVSPDGKWVYAVGFSGSAYVAKISTATNTIVSRTQLAIYGNATTAVMNTDGTKLYLTDMTDNEVLVYNTQTSIIQSVIAVHPSPYGMALSPDGSRLYVTNSATNGVSVISTVNDALLTTIPTNGQPRGISASPDGSHVYVITTGPSAVTEISTATNTVTNNMASSSTPSSVGNFVSGSSACAGTPVTFTITVNGEPTITAAGNLTAVNTVYGTPSPSVSFTVSGTTLPAGILVTPPAGFEVSIDNSIFASTLTVGSTAGNVASTTIYIRLKATTPVGNYSGNIVLSSGSTVNNSEVMPVSTVSPAALTITADNKTKVAGTVNPALTVTYAGFVNSESATQLSTQPVASTAATRQSAPGQYPITASGAVDANYTFVYVDGVLTVNPLPPTIIIPNTFTPNGDGINDVWNITNLAAYTNNTVTIYNRNGQQVFHSVGYAKPWDGTFNGIALPMGTYYYIIDPGDKTQTLSGDVTILR